MAYKKDIKPLLKELGYTWEQMQAFWDECIDINWKVGMIAKSGKNWNDLAICQIRELPILKETTLRQQKEKEERALKDFNRNRIGLYLSAVVFFIVLLVTLSGIVLNKNLMMILLVASMTGVFYFGRELRVIAKGQIIFSTVKALLCLGMAGAFTLMHQGLWDVMDYSILGILVGVVLIDIPRVIKAWKELK